MKKADEYVGFRLPSDLKTQLEKEAMGLSITLSAYIKLLLQGDLKRKGK